MQTRQYVAVVLGGVLIGGVLLINSAVQSSKDQKLQEFIFGEKANQGGQTADHDVSMLIEPDRAWALVAETTDMDLAEGLCEALNNILQKSNRGVNLANSTSAKTGRLGIIHAVFEADYKVFQQRGTQSRWKIPTRIHVTLSTRGEIQSQVFSTELAAPRVYAGSATDTRMEQIREMSKNLAGHIIGSGLFPVE